MALAKPRVRLLKPHSRGCTNRGPFEWVFSMPLQIEYRSKTGIKREGSHDRWAKFRCNTVRCKGYGVIRLRDIEQYISDALQ